MIELQSGEHIMSVERRHWFVLFLIVVRFSFGIAVVVAAPFLIKAFIPEIFESYPNFLVLGAMLLTQVLWVFFVYQFSDYYLDVWLVTNQRIILIELKGIFNRTLTSVDLRNIQDVSSKLTGIIPTLLNYGDVTVQSAGTMGEFIFRQVPKPDACKDLILRVCQEFRTSTPSA